MLSSIVKPTVVKNDTLKSMKYLQVKAELLTEENFKSYGDVVQIPSNKSKTKVINGGQCIRHNFVTDFTNIRDKHNKDFTTAKTNVCYFETKPCVRDEDGAIKLHLMERHPNSSQLFMPCNTDLNGRYLVAVCEGEEPTPDINKLKVFIADMSQGINYRANVWHHPMVSLEENVNFLCVVYENGISEEDTFIRNFSFPAKVLLS